MTLIAAVATLEGIVLAADSRMTFRHSSGVTWTQTDTITKLFSHEDMGIAISGELSTAAGKSLTSHIPEFMWNCSGSRPQQFSEKLNGEFEKAKLKAETSILVAGYDRDGDTPQVWEIDLGKGEVVRALGPSPGVIWRGEVEALARLYGDSLFVKVQSETCAEGAEPASKDQYERLEIMGLMVDAFTLQDAIDFARHAVQVTIDSSRFTLRPNTVGGAVDILLLRPRRDAQWIKRKELV